MNPFTEAQSLTEAHRLSAHNNTRQTRADETCVRLK